MGRYKTFILLTVVAFIWGSTFIFANLIVQEIPPLVGAFLRFFIASLVMIPILVFSKRKRTPVWREDLVRILILGASGVFVYNYFFFWGLKITTPVNGALIIAANPAATTLLSVLYLKEKMTLKQSLGILISFFGVGLVITRGSWEIISGLSFNHGDLMILICMFSWAVFAIFSKEAIKRLTLLETNAYAILAGTLMFIPFMAQPLREVRLAAISFGTWAALLYMGIVASVLAFFLFYKGLQQVNASQASIFVNMVPLFTMILSTFMGQPIFALQVVGGALIIFGVAVTTNLIFNSRAGVNEGPAGKMAPGQRA